MSTRKERLGRNPFEKKAGAPAPSVVAEIAPEPRPTVTLVSALSEFDLDSDVAAHSDTGFTAEFFYRDLPGAAAMLAIRGAFSLLRR